MPLEAPWQAPDALELDSETAWSWIRRNTRTRGARSFIDISIEGVYAADAGDLSLLHLLFYVHSAGGFDALVNTAGGAQQDRFVGGSQLVSERLAEGLGDALVLGAPVRRVEHGGDGVRVHADGVEVHARRAVIAHPAAAGRPHRVRARRCRRSATSSRSGCPRDR